MFKNENSKQCLLCQEKARQYRVQNALKKKQELEQLGENYQMCHVCLKNLPLEMFRDRTRGGKTSRCIPCLDRMNKYLRDNACIHGKLNKSACKECEGGSICQHGICRSSCERCGGGNLCVHKKRKDRCLECKDIYGANQYCEHNSLRSGCTICQGGGICEHGKRRTRCVECEGGSVCEHKVQRDTCKICDFAGFLVKNVRSSISRAFKSVEKTERTLDYLGCDILFYKKYLEDLFVEGMTWENHGKVWEIDHIIPIKFEDPTIEEVLERLHYTNTQPLWKHENASKGNRYISWLQQRSASSDEEDLDENSEEDLEN